MANISKPNKDYQSEIQSYVSFAEENTQNAHKNEEPSNEERAARVGLTAIPSLASSSKNDTQETNQIDNQGSEQNEEYRDKTQSHPSCVEDNTQNAHENEEPSDEERAAEVGLAPIPFPVQHSKNEPHETNLTDNRVSEQIARRLFEAFDKSNSPCGLTQEESRRVFQDFKTLSELQARDGSKMDQKIFETISASVNLIGERYQGPGLTPYDMTLLRNLAAAPENKIFTDFTTRRRYYQPQNNMLFKGILIPSQYGFGGSSVLKEAKMYCDSMDRKEICDIYGLKKTSRECSYEEISSGKHHPGMVERFMSWLSEEKKFIAAAKEKQKRFINNINAIIGRKIIDLNYREAQIVFEQDVLVNKFGYSRENASKYAVIIFLFYKPYENAVNDQRSTRNVEEVNSEEFNLRQFLYSETERHKNFRDRLDAEDCHAHPATVKDAHDNEQEDLR